MASNVVTPIGSIERIRGARIGERRDTYFSQLEEWRIYSQLLAAERRQQELEGLTPNLPEGRMRHE